MYGYAMVDESKVKRVKHEMKVVMIDMALDAGIGIAFRVIPVPVVRGCLALAKIGVDVKMMYDSIKLMKHSLEAMN